jgi:hypothetical protein
MFFQDINNFKTFLNIIINTIPNKHVVSTMKQRKLKKKEEEMIHRDKRIDATSPLT